MNPIPITILFFSIGAICLFVGLIIGAGLTVIGMTREQKRLHRGMWHMELLENGKMIQEFYNCPSIGLKFKDLDKNIPRAYEIRISRIREGKDGIAKYIREKSTKTDVVMRYYE